MLENAHSLIGVGNCVGYDLDLGTDGCIASGSAPQGYHLCFNFGFGHSGVHLDGSGWASDDVHQNGDGIGGSNRTNYTNGDGWGWGV